MYNKEIIEIYKNLLDSSHHAMAFIFGILSSLLATIGLATNSGTTIIGSMLISPIGSLLTKNILYSFLKNNTKIEISVKYKNWFIQLCVVLIITLILSYLFGKILQKIKNPYTNKYLSENWPTNEMKERSKVFNAVYMIFIAGLCGIALPVALTRNSDLNLVGIGIATAIIPPIANIGLSYSMYSNKPEIKEYKKQSLITGISIFCINMILLWLPSKLMIKEITKKHNLFKYIEWLFINPSFFLRYKDYKNFLKIDNKYDGNVTYNSYITHFKPTKIFKDYFKKNKFLTLKNYFNLLDKQNKK
jgi:hypothetical protein